MVLTAGLVRYKSLLSSLLRDFFSLFSLIHVERFFLLVNICIIGQALSYTLFVPLVPLERKPLLQANL